MHDELGFYVYNPDIGDTCARVRFICRRRLVAF